MKILNRLSDYCVERNLFTGTYIDVDPHSRVDRPINNMVNVTDKNLTQGGDKVGPWAIGLQKEWVSPEKINELQFVSVSRLLFVKISKFVCVKLVRKYATVACGQKQCVSLFE